MSGMALSRPNAMSVYLSPFGAKADIQHGAAPPASVAIHPSLPLTTHELRIATWPLGNPFR
jgi:hypothetical protein